MLCIKALVPLEEHVLVLRDVFQRAALAALQARARGGVDIDRPESAVSHLRPEQVPDLSLGHGRESRASGVL